MTINLSQGDAIDAIEAAFARHARWADGTPNREEATRNLFYAARKFANYDGKSYLDAVYELAAYTTDKDAIEELPSRVARARS